MKIRAFDFRHGTALATDVRREDDRLFRIALWTIVLVAAMLIMLSLGLFPSSGLVPT